MSNLTHAKAILLITLVLVAVYGATLNNSFVWDDAWVISDNQFIKSWKNFPMLFRGEYLTSFDDFGFLGERQIGSGEASYRPIVTATYFIDYALWGLNPAGYHFINLLLHLCNAILLYFFVVVIAKDKTIALLAAIIFTLHPVNSEAVAVVSFREDLLAFLFFMAALILYTIKKPVAYIASLILFLFALFSKEMALTLPFILILYDFYFEKVRKFKPIYLGYIAVSIFYLLVWGFLMQNHTKIIAFPGGNFYTNTVTMLAIVGQYISWVVLPFGIHAVAPDNSALIFYSFTVKVYICLLLIIAVLILAVKLYKLSPVASFAIFWSFLTLLPVCNLIPVLNTLMGSRFLYIPIVGFCLCAAALLGTQKISFKNTIVITVIILALYLGLIIKRIQVYKDNISLWSEMAEFYPENALVHADLGIALEQKGLSDKAVSEYQAAILLDPGSAKAYFGLGNYYFTRDMFSEAFVVYKKGLAQLKLKPSLARAYNKLGNLFFSRGRYEEAEVFLNEANKINPR